MNRAALITADCILHVPVVRYERSWRPTGYMSYTHGNYTHGIFQTPALVEADDFDGGSPANGRKVALCVERYDHPVDAFPRSPRIQRAPVLIFGELQGVVPAWVLDVKLVTLWMGSVDDLEVEAAFIRQCMSYGPIEFHLYADWLGEQGRGEEEASFCEFAQTVPAALATFANVGVFRTRSTPASGREP
jgi:hypothetical protein